MKYRDVILHNAVCESDRRLLHDALSLMLRVLFEHRDGLVISGPRFVCASDGGEFSLMIFRSASTRD